MERIMDAQSHIVILTGAGISAESGIATFRGQSGLWEDHAIEDVATPEGFVRNPELVHQFYNQRRKKMLSSEIQPNAAHFALAKLEQVWPSDVLLVTQNVDNLHEQAGSKNMIHMHGELLKVRCSRSQRVFEWKEDLSLQTPCPCCNATATLRPHVVWFGEMPLEMARIYRALHDCGLFLAIGTSGNVYPAAGFVHEVRAVGNAHTVELNLEPSQGHNEFEERIYGPATQIVPDFVDRFLSEHNLTDPQV